MCYANLLEEIKTRIGRSRTQDVVSPNAGLVRLYWDIGRMIEDRMRQEGWETAVIARLAQDLRNERSVEKGYSERGIKRMLSFYRAYRETVSLAPNAEAQRAVDPNDPPAEARRDDPENSIVWLIPWGHHALLMDSVGDLSTRLWYMEQTLAKGWSHEVLRLMIKSNAHGRQGRAVTNFEQSLPPPQADLTRQILKDPYLFDFFTLEEPFHERALETALIDHLERFLFELGQGFAFVGRQYLIRVGELDFHIDLLFYHVQLRAFVVIDLKTGPFRPEYAGKLNFYCNVVNATLRHSSQQPTIGLILCQGKEHQLAEYALAGIDKPIGVSSYQLARASPSQRQSVVPTVEELDAERDEVPSESTVDPGTATGDRVPGPATRPRRPTSRKPRNRRQNT